MREQDQAVTKKFAVKTLMYVELAPFNIAYCLLLIYHIDYACDLLLN